MGEYCNNQTNKKYLSKQEFT